MPRRRGRSLRSGRYREMVAALPSAGTVSVREAVDVLKGNPRPTRFDETVDLAIKLDINPKQADEQVRGAFSLPRGIGRSVRVIAFCEGEAGQAALEAGAIEAGVAELVKKIQDGWAEFDVAVAHPSAMRAVGRLGRILGPQGKMPSPKSGTVTPDVVQAVKEFSAGKIEYRNDSFGNIHVPVGKLSFSPEDLVANVEAMIGHILSVRPAAVRGTYVERVTLSSTMGPGIEVRAS